MAVQFIIAGQVVRTLIDEDKKIGSYEIVWNGKDESGKRVSAGLYFYKLNAGYINVVKRLALVK